MTFKASHGAIALGLAVAVGSAMLCSITGCQTVEIEFAPAPTADSAADLEKIRSLAASGYEFVAPTRTVLVVSPKDELGIRKEPAKDQGPASPTAGTSQNDPPAGPPAKPGKPGKQPPAKADGTEGKGAALKKRAGATKAASQPSQGSGGDAPVSTNQADALATATIDSQTWAAVAVPVANYDRGFFVHGVSGFWKGTTIALSRYPNSDRLSSIAITAENYTPKRIQDAASIATAVISIAGFAVSDESESLLPFKLELPQKSTTVPQVLQNHWAYMLEYEGSNVGTVPMDTGSLPKGKVNYWPVPACQVAKLTLTHDDRSHVFYVTVASPGRFRLQPLPAAGKIDLGSICGASSSGVTASDPLGTVSDDVTALQQAVQKLKPPPAASGVSPGKGGGKSPPPKQ